MKTKVSHIPNQILLALLEQRIEKLLTSAEICSPAPRERVSQVDHTAARSEVKNAERAGFFESLSPRCSCASAIVDENEVGREGQSERDGRLLAFVQRAQWRIITRLDRTYLEPVGSQFHPVSHHLQRRRVTQFFVYNRGDEYLLERSRLESNLIDRQ